MPRCVALKANETRCKCNAVKGSTFCGTHQGWSNVYVPNFNVMSYDDNFGFNMNNVDVETPKITTIDISDICDMFGR